MQEATASTVTKMTIVSCQEGADRAEGELGGHSARFGEDTGDEVYGGENDDVILGEAVIQYLIGQTLSLLSSSFL
jgi:hypothetical protein